MVVIFCTQVVYSNSSKGRRISHPQKGCGYGHMIFLIILPFVVMQRIARVRQRQLSYLFVLLDEISFAGQRGQSTL